MVPRFKMPKRSDRYVRCDGCQGRRPSSGVTLVTINGTDRLLCRKCERAHRRNLRAAKAGGR